MACSHGSRVVTELYDINGTAVLAIERVINQLLVISTWMNELCSVFFLSKFRKMRYDMIKQNRTDYPRKKGLKKTSINKWNAISQLKSYLTEA